jgi:hypoxanthine-guanine phosphoribosyltransferase
MPTPYTHNPETLTIQVGDSIVTTSLSYHEPLEAFETLLKAVKEQFSSWRTVPELPDDPFIVTITNGLNCFTTRMTQHVEFDVLLALMEATRKLKNTDNYRQDKMVEEVASALLDQPVPVAA